MKQGTIAIRRIFSLIAHDYKDRIFKLVRIFRNLHDKVGKYFNFSIGVTSQQFLSFKFVKICAFRTQPSFSRFHTGYISDQISRKCRGTFQRHKRWNIDGRNVMQLKKQQHQKKKNKKKKKTFYHCACARDLHGNVMYVTRTLNSVLFKFIFR